MLRGIHRIHCIEMGDQSRLVFIIMSWGSLRLMPGRLDWNPEVLHIQLELDFKPKLYLAALSRGY